MSQELNDLYKELISLRTVLNQLTLLWKAHLTGEEITLADLEVLEKQWNQLLTPVTLHPSREELLYQQYSKEITETDLQIERLGKHRQELRQLRQELQDRQQPRSKMTGWTDFRALQPEPTSLRGTAPSTTDHHWGAQEPGFTPPPEPISSQSDQPTTFPIHAELNYEYVEWLQGIASQLSAAIRALAADLHTSTSVKPGSPSSVDTPATTSPASPFPGTTEVGPY